MHRITPINKRGEGRRKRGALDRLRRKGEGWERGNRGKEKYVL